MSFLANFTSFDVFNNFLSYVTSSKKRGRDHDNIPRTPPPSKKRRHENMLTPGQKLLRDKRDKERTRRKMLAKQFIPIDLQNSLDLENKYPNLFYILVGKIGDQVYIKPGFTNANLPQRMNDLKAKYGFDTLLLKELYSINSISDEHDVQKYLSSKFSSVGELNGKVTTEIYLDSKDVCNTIKKGLQVVGYDSHLKQHYPLEKTI